MTETERILAQLKKSFYGEAWHGPSLMEALKDVTAEQAIQHPIANAHSIWELVLHLKCWISVIDRGIAGEKVDVTDEMNFPAVSSASDAAWDDAIEKLKGAFGELERTVATLGESDLEKKAIGGEDTIYTVVHGVIQHNLYHAGQILLLKKAK